MAEKVQEAVEEEDSGAGAGACDEEVEKSGKAAMDEDDAADWGEVVGSMCELRTKAWINCQL